MTSEIASVIRELTEPVSNGEYSSMEEKTNSNSVRFAFFPWFFIACCTVSLKFTLQFIYNS